MRGPDPLDEDLLDLDLQGEVEVLLWLIEAATRATGPMDAAAIDAVLFASLVRPPDLSCPERPDASPPSRVTRTKPTTPRIQA